MIALITGKLITKSPDSVILDVNGIGYRVHAPLSTYCALPDLEKTVTLHIYTHIREDTFKLFGFLTPQEQFVFEKLISVSKIGPKLALNILSGISTGELETAIMQSDVRKLASIPGVGKKTAQRLIIELKDKLKAQHPSVVTGAPYHHASSDKDLINDALSALINLGFPMEKAERAVVDVFRKKQEDEWSIEQLIKESLKALV